VLVLLFLLRLLVLVLLVLALVLVRLSARLLPRPPLLHGPPPSTARTHACPAQCSA
jgi:hypothetical protein